MVLELNREHISDNTERYQHTGLSPVFLADILKVVTALKTTGYEPYDQLTGYVRTGNDAYITRFGNARAIVLSMDVHDIKTFLMHYKEY